MHVKFNGICKMIFCISCLVALCSCAGVARNSLTVCVASSLALPMKEIATSYEKIYNIKVNLNIAGSGTLKRQILSGAPVDIAILASVADVDELKAAGMVAASTWLPISNSIVLVVKNDSTLNYEAFLDGNHRLAIGDPIASPSGRYAKEIVDKLGIYRGGQNIVYTADVTSAVTSVAQGHAQFAIAYLSDVAGRGEVNVAHAFPAALHSEIAYPIAEVRGSSLAQKFIEFAIQPESIKVFGKYDFLLRKR